MSDLKTHYFKVYPERRESFERAVEGLKKAEAAKNKEAIKWYLGYLEALEAVFNAWVFSIEEKGGSYDHQHGSKFRRG